MDDAPGVRGLGPAELRAALSSTDPARRAAGVSRARPGPGVEELVIAALRDAHQEVRRASVRTLARIGGPIAARALVETSSRDVSPAVRAEAVAALGRLLAARGGASGGTEVSEPGKAPD